MRIAQVAPLYERVPPALYGGTERVVSYLTEELVRLGHDVTLFASGDSVTAARLWSPCRQALRLDPTCHDSLAPHVQMLGFVYHQASAFDVIHCHTDYLGLPLARFVRTPTLLTLHGRLDIPELAPLYAEYREVPLISISNAQRTPLPDAHWVATAYHGLPSNLYQYVPRSEDYLLFLGRISPEKRPDIAIRVARRAGVPLRIAAKVDPVDCDYFEREIRPLLDDPLIDFIGEVGEEAKRTVLGSARALLFPIDWPEPFGLVLIEALACGTPVIARPRGSVPEVVQHGETGWLCDTEDEMVAAVQRLGELDRARCRAAFDSRFTAAIMTARYVHLYQQLLSGNAEQSISTAGDAANVPPCEP
jgi:glycosyltransferase involved in cell wall biosynthesis